MSSFFKLFLVSAAAFAVLDFLWLGYFMKSFNMRQLAEIGRFKENEFDLLYGPASLVYFLMAVSIPLFVLPRVKVEDPLWIAFLTGAAMGLIVYGIFDMTNLAILRKYPLSFALVDMAWGTFAYGAVSALAKTVRDY